MDSIVASLDRCETATTRLCASSRLADLNKAAAEGERIGLVAKAVTDRLVPQVDVHVPAAEPLIEPIKNPHQLVIEREGHLIRICAWPAP